MLKSLELNSDSSPAFTINATLSSLSSNSSPPCCDSLRLGAMLALSNHSDKE
jgi:hypothetical protein